MPRAPTRFWHPARRSARRLHAATRDLVQRRFRSQTQQPVPLDDVRLRLQRYLRAMYGVSVAIEAVEEQLERAPWKVRALATLGIAQKVPASESDEQRIRLPAQLTGDASGVTPVERYRVLAVQHAERITRRSAERAAETTSVLERDLYLLAEAATIDANVRRGQPGLRKALDAARESSLARRPKPRWCTDIELRVEAMVRSAFEESADRLVPDDQTTSDWARRTAAALEAEFGRQAAREYREAPPIMLWDMLVSARTSSDGDAPNSKAIDSHDAQLKPMESTRRSSSMPGPSSSASAQGKGGTTRSRSSSGESAASPNERGEADSASPDADGEGEDGSPSEHQGPEARGAADPGVRETTPDGKAAGSTSSQDDGSAGPGTRITRKSGVDPDDGDVAFHYPEWDTYANALHPTGTIVRASTAPTAPSDWADSALAAHMMLAHQARQQFERLRSHRVRLKRQLQGDDLDLEACVESVVGRRMGHAASDRLYSMVRPGRRDLAITLLIDVSGSTEEKVHGDERAIDIERTSALIASAAFDALGDDYSILAFSSHGARNVRVRTVKEFRERNSDVVRQRIAGLEPSGTTRLGAAVRHATAQLERHHAPHRLLLILSDGKPYDYDWYFVDYAVDDSRRAVMEARARGIHPFCVTVDRAEGPEYMTDIFGSSGYLLVKRPSQLPRALLGAVQRLLA